MLIIGCDFHTRFQKIAMMDTTTGELVTRRLEHGTGEAERFYAALAAPVRVGIEATLATQWFEKMLRHYGHELWIGDAAEIRAAMVRKQKTDDRDALHILDLPMQNRCPRRGGQPAHGRRRGAARGSGARDSSGLRVERRTGEQLSEQQKPGALARPESQ